MIEQIERRIVRISDIELGNRKREELGSIEDLAKSIKTYGLLHPPAVKELEDGKFKLLAGGRRIFALLLLKCPTVLVTIYHKDLSDLELRSIELIENIDRKDLTWHERIKLISEIHNLQVEIYGSSAGAAGTRTDHGVVAGPEKTGWSLSHTAEVLGMKQPQVSADLGLAAAMNVVPKLKDCKDRKEALNYLKNAQKSAIRKEKIQAIESEKSSTPEAKLKQRLQDSFIIGDTLKLMPLMLSQSVDWIELDPPYGIDLLSKLKGNGLTKLTYNEISLDEYPSFMNKVLNECYRVLSPSGWLICWFGIDWYDAICSNLRNIGFRTPTVPCIWTKGPYQAQTNQPSTILANSYETFFYAQKGRAELRKKGRINQFDFRCVIPTSKIHPTERPIELIQEVLNTFAEPRSIGLVPFLGSGNTLLAASNLGMIAHGYELSADYKDGYIVRVNEGGFGKYKSYKQENVNA